MDSCFLIIVKVNKYINIKSRERGIYLHIIYRLAAFRLAGLVLIARIERSAKPACENGKIVAVKSKFHSHV